MKWYVRVRRVFQLGTLALLCTLPWLNAREIHVVSGNFFALDLGGLPFADPASVVQIAAGGLVPGQKLLLGALATLLLAACLGRVFCSWLCPYGLLSEGIHRLSGLCGTKINRRKPWHGIAMRSCVFVFGLALVALCGFPLLNRLSLPGEISLLPLLLWNKTFAWDFFAFLLVLLCLELFLGRRLWCRFLCPQSVLLSVVARFAPGMKVRWTPEACTCDKHSPCQSACSLALNPRQKGGPNRCECNNCGDCVKECSHHGNALRFGG